MRLALYQPDIAQNCGAVMRLCAAMGVPLDLIEPFGFVWDDAKIRRVAMDYYDHVTLQRHKNWDAFLAAHGQARLVLLTTKTALAYTDFHFAHRDILLFGRESAGAPEEVHAHADARITIPMAGAARSMNVAMTASMVLGEALRQTRTMS